MTTYEITIMGRQIWITIDKVRLNNGRQIIEYPIYVSYFSKSKPKFLYREMVRIHGKPQFFSNKREAVKQTVIFLKKKMR